VETTALAVGVFCRYRRRRVCPIFRSEYFALNICSRFCVFVNI